MKNRKVFGALRMVDGNWAVNEESQIRSDPVETLTMGSANTPVTVTLLEPSTVINLTSRNLTLFCLDSSGSEKRLDIPASGRAFVRRPKMWQRSFGGSIQIADKIGLVIPLGRVQPQEDLLGPSEIVVGLPPTRDGRSYYLVTTEVAYTLNRRKEMRRDILIPGKARKDPSTGEIEGFENLNLFQFTGNG
ncbi:MAG: hypothetical protein JRN15_11635 [Nitrososphaerota archaeon]|nr:hypothetical protein [Nitrososphaerota archaeon]